MPGIFGSWLKTGVTKEQENKREDDNNNKYQTAVKEVRT